MKNKIVCIFVMALLIATTIPVIGTMNLNKIQVNEKDTIYKENIVETSKITEKVNEISTLKEILIKQCPFYSVSQQDYPWEPSDAGNYDPIYHRGSVGIGSNLTEGLLMVADAEGNGMIVCKEDPTGNIIILVGYDNEGNRVVIGGGYTLFNVYSATGNGFM